ncbi:MAG: C25 family cysteine peptidase, partial [Bacteroidota bacterium]
DPCLSEAFIRNPNGGSILYWGSSRAGWMHKGSSDPARIEKLGGSNLFNAEFFKYLFTDQSSSGRCSFAKITTTTKVHFISRSYRYNLTERWLQFALNAIGDPEVPIWTKNPSNFTTISVTDNGTNVTVNTGVSNCKICVMSKGDGGDNYWNVAKNTSNHTFDNVPEPYIVTVTKHNYIPYVYDSDVAGNSDFFVQDKTFPNSKKIFAQNNISVGSDVTTTISSGQVSLEPGSDIVLSPGNTLEIKNDFEVKVGAEFEIKTDNLFPYYTFYHGNNVSVSQSGASEWHTENLPEGYNEPVVVLGPISYNGPNPCNVRIKSITGNSFEYQIDEWNYLDGAHITERIDYIVMEAGTYTIDGLKAEAGIIEDVHGNFKNHTFSQNFSEPPVVLTQVVGVNNASAIVTRLRNISTSGFEVRTQEEEASDGVYFFEKIAFIAIEPGYGSLSGNLIEVGRTNNAVTDNWYTVSFDNNNFTNTPTTFVGQIQTYDGSDPCGLRKQSMSSSGVTIKVEEEKSADRETNHTSEVVGYIVIE